MIENYIAKKSLDLAFKKAQSILANMGGSFDSDEAMLERCLKTHLNFASNWAGEISFTDLQKAKNIGDVYIPLDLYVTPLRSRITEDEEVTSIRLDQAIDFSNQRHFVLLGHPGAGKTTTMKHVCQQLLGDNEGLLPDTSFPLVIKLRDVNKRRRADLPDPDLFKDILWSLFHQILGIQIIYPEGLETLDERSNIRKLTILEALESLCPAIILDGYDEIIDKVNRDTVLSEIRELGTSLNKAQLLVTSRTGNFNYNLDGFDHFEIRPLNDSQVREFVSKWIVDGEKIKILLDQLDNSPFKDTAIRPLTLAHLCAIFERIGRIPEKPKTVYRKVVNLLIEEWDEQRSVERGSNYASFSADRKFEFLCELAYTLTNSVGKSIFKRQDLTKSYERICGNYALPRNQARTVARELESHTGLFIESGYHLFEFSHKSIQEYLTAEYVVRLPEIPLRVGNIRKIPNELAIAVSISSSPSDYICTLVLNRFKLIPEKQSEFIQTFVNRLLVEKPDFNQSTLVGWALVILYSMHFIRSLNNLSQLELFASDTMAREFDVLSKMIKARIRKSEVYRFYEKIQEQEALDGVIVQTLEKKNGFEHFDGSNRFDGIHLPDILKIRDTLLE